MTRAGPSQSERLARTDRILAERKPLIAIADKGYQGVEIEEVRILRSGQKRGITRTLKAMIHRRSAIEPAIGHMRWTVALAGIL